MTITASVTGTITAMPLLSNDGMYHRDHGSEKSYACVTFQ